MSKINKTPKLKEYRCYNCKRILCKATDGLDIEAICPRCRRINYPARTDQGVGLRGKDFQSKCIEHNCSKCKRLLLKSIGYGVVEIECIKCFKNTKERERHNTLNIRKKVFKLTAKVIEELQVKYNLSTES